jgi:hypothetical protein
MSIVKSAPNSLQATYPQEDRATCEALPLQVIDVNLQGQGIQQERIQGMNTTQEGTILQLHKPSKAPTLLSHVLR